MTRPIANAGLMLLPQNRHWMYLMDYKPVATSNVLYHKVSLSEGQNSILQ